MNVLNSYLLVVYYVYQTNTDNVKHTKRVQLTKIYCSILKSESLFYPAIPEGIAESYGLEGTVWLVWYRNGIIFPIAVASSFTTSYKTYN